MAYDILLRNVMNDIFAVGKYVGTCGRHYIERSGTRHLCLPSYLYLTNISSERSSDIIRHGRISSAPQGAVSLNHNLATLNYDFLGVFMNNIEILAPVGGKEQLIAAVRSGADAVYFGASSFNARRNADNFTDEEFIGAVKYCRERGVKAYITLNTLMKESEKDELLDTVRLIAKSGADAVIIQDLGVLSLLKKCCPHIPVHASTQMACHNVSGARLLQSLGFSRIVLARELSIKEIKEITAAVNTEIEVFVHGAHCMSTSGMCYMSSFLGARSGNRGLCAQPCRLNFKYKKREYALSLKDMCLAGRVDELIMAGVTSLKIEGRMKRPEYVASAVTAYKDAVNGKIPDTRLLQSIFSRSGFTDGYAAGKRDLSMFGYRTKEDVVAANDVLSGVANTYRNENPLVSVTMNFYAKENESSRLEISDGANTVTVTGAVPEKAERVALNEEAARKNLGKLGSTFYFADSIKCDIGEGLMLRASDINSLRRDATDELTRVRGKKKEYAFSVPGEKSRSFRMKENCELRLMFEKVSFVPENITADKIILPVRELCKNTEFVKKYAGILVASLPALIYPEGEERIKNDLKLLFSLGVKYALCDNIGAVEIAKSEGFSCLGGALLNILNSEASELLYTLGVRDITLSPEMSFREMKSVRTRAKTGFIAYGYMPLMHFRCCPLKGENGCGECKGRGEITDRMGEKFTVLCKMKSYSVLYNTVPLYVGDKTLPEADFVTLAFTTEAPFEVRKITEAFINKKALAGKKTAGLYERELL